MGKHSATPAKAGLLKSLRIPALILAALLILAVFAVAYLTTQYVSLGSVLGCITFAVGFVIWHRQDPLVLALGVLMGALATYMHRENIKRLLNGTERKTNLFKKK